MHRVEYRRNQKQLREAPALPATLNQDSTYAHQLLSQALYRSVTALDTHEVQPVLQAYGLATLSTWIAITACNN